ncbi:hypothetical protein C4D60_Mb05t26780 [Musa balbisiana]|uniref:TCP domain-containing protein n=1 Tax=Musa balbisiana TaxID=52838 RepID=A0A4S8JZ24_MUSBA|nr:hypothetical protein C4D60_Mb05t26780 [Musa balbisiana]
MVFPAPEFVSLVLRTPLLASISTARSPKSKLCLAMDRRDSSKQPQEAPRLDELEQARPNWPMLAAANFGPPLPGLLLPPGVLDSGFMPSSSSFGTGNGPMGSFLQRVGMHGMDLPGADVGAMSFVSMLAPHGQQSPGLELGLSQDGHGGEFHPQATYQLFPQIGRARGGAGSSEVGQLQHHQQQQQPQAFPTQDDSQD